MWMSSLKNSKKLKLSVLFLSKILFITDITDYLTLVKLKSICRFLVGGRNIRILTILSEFKHAFKYKRAFKN